MNSVSRFPDWCSLSESDRVAALEQNRARLAGVGRELNAVKHVLPAEVPGQGPLAGMPYVAKDMIATGAVAPSWGCSEPMASALPRASVIDRMEQAGACLIGTAVMTELAYEPSGFVRGGALNPWGADAIPGGSSTGSAILVAAGCCFAALGSDTGGSVRIPASCCGVTGLKPSYGGLPVDGTMPLAPSLDTIGILARSAADLALIWPSISGQRKSPVAGNPSGTLLADAFDASDPQVREICRGAVGVLAATGMQIDARPGFPEQADQNALLVLQAEAARQHKERIDDPRIDATLRKRLRKGLTISDEALGTALEARDALRRDFLSRYLGEASVALLPVMPIATPGVEEVDTGSANFNPRTLYALSRFTRFVNYLGLPALAVPAGFDNRGLPVGLQIIGRPGSDALLLEIGVALQARTSWHGRIPPGVSGQEPKVALAMRDVTRSLHKMCLG
jgi:aspartyl-tRNA(Asn)/glutamyl-tRNA(Gln) amidotransferase subunit A